ncbi:type 2 periplasmic-binding domain-containing protein [Gilvimarinus agarilyticus]|uniref:transporter substrate-binding domain-containing protein n=1 Tax=Gilvimarinus agarilyticus TaxID=679259 RepID=UPI0005A2C623|nr:transporter substrate-binding domain-containing protein [Gilvimarinus agarilyticus]
MSVSLWASKSGRGEFELALLKAILERTEQHYPPYQLSVMHDPLGTQRGRQVIADGELANVYVSGLREDDYTREQQILLVRQPTMKGLIGYRSAIIRTNDAERFAKAAADNDLRSLVIGQGRGWEDAKILRFNHYTVNDNGRFTNLFEMLNYGRFDALLLGAVEAKQELAASPLKAELSVAEQPIVYYPHAMVFQVSGKHPELAHRIAEGFEQLIQDGSHEQFLEQYFGDTIRHIRDKNTRIIVLKHPDPTLMPELAKPLLRQQDTP